MSLGAGVPRYFEAVEQLHGLARSNVAPYLESIFGGLELAGKDMLDVGGGPGLNTFYAACCGASVLCLEAEAAGSAADAARRFTELASLLDVEHVTLCRSTLQAFDAEGKTFDVVLLHNSINHLDEAACMALRDRSSARAAYAGLCRTLADLTNPGGQLVVTDCSPYNVFPLLGRRNPYAPTIEWRKHHRPSVWIELLCQAGFADAKVTWPAPYRLRGLGPVLLGNEVASFFLSSHFRIQMEKG